MKTNKTVAIVIGMLLVLLAAAPASATYYLKVSWGHTVGVYYNLAGFGNRTSNIGPATGELGISGPPDDYGNPPTTPTVVESVGRIFCADLFQFDYGNWHDVGVYTEADGTTGWTTPSDTDQYRDPNGLGRAAYLANTYGFDWLTAGGAADVQNRTIALNVAIWKAAYGARFTLLPNFSPGWETYYYNILLPAYNTRSSENMYRWFDSNQANSDDEFQDFLQPVAVPEPGTTLLVGSILLGSALLAMRRRKPTV